MSRKMTCPGCDAYSSGVVTAYEEGEPCPYCGLPAMVTAEILDARERHANAELTSKYEEAMKRIGRLEAERNSLRTALNEIRTALRHHDETVRPEA